jgi:hypothetical protein
MTCPLGLLPRDVSTWSTPKGRGCHPKTTCHYSDKCHAQLHLRGAFSKSTQPDMGRRSGRPHRLTQPIHLPRTTEEKTHHRSTQLSPSGRRQREGTTHSQIDPTHCPREKIWRVSSQVDPAHYSREKTWRMSHEVAINNTPS